MAGSPSSYRCRYHVFLSSRGEDTRKGFTDHLYRALEMAGIHTFRDDDEIERGAEIAVELQNAIQESQVSLIVFSKDYASSRWCLEELTKIMKRKRNDGHIIPINLHQNLRVRGREEGDFSLPIRRKKEEDLLKESLERRKERLGRFEFVPNFGISVSHSKFQSLKGIS